MIEGTIFRKCLKEAFASACVADDGALAKTEVYAVMNSPFNYNFDIIQKMISRYWTDDFIDDMIVNEGSGVFIPGDFLIDLSRRFWGMLSFEAYGRALEFDIQNGTDRASGIFPQADVIKMIEKLIRSDMDSFSKNVLLNQEVRDYNKPLAGLNDSSTEVSGFLYAHAFMIPLYLVFITGVYSEVRMEINLVQDNSARERAPNR